MNKKSNNISNELNNCINEENNNTCAANKVLMEAYYKHVGEAHISNIIKDLDSKKDEIENIEISDSFHHQMMAVINLKKKEKKRKKRISQIKQIASRAAIVILTLCVIMTVVTFSVEAVRVKVFNLFIDIQDKYSDIEFEEEIDQEEKGYYFPDYLPKGYTISSNENLGMMRFIHFANNDNIIKFIQAKNGTSFRVDSENAVTSDILINENKGILIIKKDRINIIWSNEEASFSLAGQIDKEEIIKIAENIEKK